MLPLIVFAAILSQSNINVLGSDNSLTIYCSDVDTSLDYDKFLGAWFEVAAMTSIGQNPNDFNNAVCLKAKFMRLVRKTSDDLYARFGDTETMILKNVDSLGRRGCYQRAKALDGPVIDVGLGRYINLMMMQFYLVKSSELFLVQITWETRASDDTVLIYKRTPDGSVSVEDLNPVVDLVTKLRGPHSAPRFCSRDYNQHPYNLLN